MSPNKEQRPNTCREFVEDLTGHSTRKPAENPAAAVDQDLWYLVYKDEEGAMHTVKGSTTAIRRSLKEGLLGDASNVRASRAKTGPFEQLRSYPEFRDLVVTPTALTVPTVGSSTTTPIATAGSQTAVKRPSTPSTPSINQPAAAPHIELGSGAQANLEWLKWVLLVLLGVLTAVVAYYLF